MSRINTMEILTEDLVAAVAAELEHRVEHGADWATLAERKDLEPSAVAGLASVFGERVEKSRKVNVPYWARVGAVDLVVREAPGSERLCLAAELKWCKPAHDILYEGIWDMFKMALTTGLQEHPRAYLISGAEQSLWGQSDFADLFDDATHDPVELCSRRLRDSKRTLAWDDLLRGGYDSFPDQLPARIDTAVVGRVPVGEWELRAVQVTVSGDDRITMDGGWPYGDRPEDARRPIWPTRR